MRECERLVCSASKEIQDVSIELRPHGSITELIRHSPSNQGNDVYVIIQIICEGLLWIGEGVKSRMPCFYSREFGSGLSFIILLSPIISLETTMWVSRSRIFLVTYVRVRTLLPSSALCVRLGYCWTTIPLLDGIVQNSRCWMTMKSVADFCANAPLNTLFQSYDLTTFLLQRNVLRKICI